MGNRVDHCCREQLIDSILAHQSANLWYILDFTISYCLRPHRHGSPGLNDALLGILTFDPCQGRH